MHFQQILCLSTVLYFVSTTELDEKFHKLLDAKWQCDTICVGSGGEVEYNSETNICKCTLNNDIDDEDLDLMFKNSRNMGIALLTIEPIENKTTSKRETVQKELSPPIITNAIPQQETRRRRSTVRPINSIFTTRSTTTPKYTHKTTTHRPLRQRTTTKSTHTRSNVDQQTRMQEFQKRMEEIRQSHRSRATPNFQQRSAFNSGDSHSRLVDQFRERQQQWQQRRASVAPRVGAAQPTTSSPIEDISSSIKPSSTESTSTKGTSLEHTNKQTELVSVKEDVVEEKKSPNIFIVTQDPSLIDGDNNF